MSFNFFKRLAKIALLLVLVGNYAYGLEKNDSSSIEDRLIKDALKNINYELNNKKGTLDRIDCCYKVPRTGPLSASIKTFYVDYRKAAESKNYDFKNAVKLAKCDQDQIIEIIYKSNEKNQLTIVSKKNRRRSCKYVAIA